MDKYGNTPLHIAAKYGHELLISTLMTNGADTARYASPWRAAPSTRWEETCFCQTCLLRAGTAGQRCRSDVFILIYFSVSRRGIHGMFPLHLAVLYGFSDCCRKLLSSGLDSFNALLD